MGNAGASVPHFPFHSAGQAEIVRNDLCDVRHLVAQIRKIADTVSYIDENGETQTVEAGVLEDGGQPYGAQGETNWYIIKGVSSVSDQVSFYDAQVNLIIADGAELTFGGNSRNLVCFNGSLRIYAQEAGTGKLTLTGHNRITSMYGDVQIIGGEITTEAITPDYMNGNGTLYVEEFREDKF